MGSFSLVIIEALDNVYGTTWYLDNSFSPYPLKCVLVAFCMDGISQNEITHAK